MTATRYRTGIIVGSNRRESINRRLALALAKLVEDRLIARESAPGADERRKTYVATARGREVLRSEIARRERLAVLGRRALAAEEE
jgi:DNA-binding PadR family transcriptional regulator